MNMGWLLEERDDRLLTIWSGVVSVEGLIGFGRGCRVELGVSDPNNKIVCECML